MADASNKAAHKRVSIGATLATLGTALVNGLYRVAATYDSATGSKGWLWLIFESAVLLWTLPFLALMYCAAGAWLVFKGNGSRRQAMIICAVTGLAYGVGLYLIGLMNVAEMGLLSSSPVTLAVLALSGAAGGYAGHAGWNASDRKLESLDDTRDETDAA